MLENSPNMLEQAFIDTVHIQLKMDLQSGVKIY